MHCLKRKVRNKPISCEHCGFLEEVFVEYVDDGASYCPWCAHANSAITLQDVLEDELDNLDKGIEYYEEKVRKLKDVYREKLQGPKKRTKPEKD